MSRKQAEIVSINALNHIIKHGAQMAKDNLTIKNHLFNYSNKQGLSITNHLVVQSGEEQQRINEKTNQQLVPSKARKDNRFSNSVNTSPFKPDLNFKSGKLGISSRQTATHRSPRYANKSQYLVSKKISLRSRDDRSHIRFIDLTDIMQPATDGKKITHEMKTQRNYIQKMRERIVSLDQNNRLKKQQEEQKTLKDKQRIEQLKNKFKKHMSKNNNNNISFDVDGNYIFVEAQDQQKALKRKYPPPNINFSFDQPLQLKIEQKKQPHIKQRAARGQVFASSVLKTMNMSKISLNLTTKTCNIDQFTFMRRNDLFNNNHSRQVTTIPYLQVSQGTNYTQTHTNTSVSKRTHRTAHSENKSKFKTHNLLQNLKENFQNNTNKTQFIEDELKIDQKRIQSSRPYTRPKTSMPKTAKTADRVTQVNKHLVCELIE